MLALKRLALMLSISATILSSALAGPNAAGTWKGHVEIDMSKLPKASTPQAQQEMARGLAKAKGITITLVFNANKTFTASAAGTGTNDNSDSGTWSQSGNTVTMKSTKKGHTTEPAKTASLSANGKTLTIAAGPYAKVVLHR